MSIFTLEIHAGPLIYLRFFMLNTICQPRTNRNLSVHAQQTHSYAMGWTSTLAYQPPIHHSPIHHSPLIHPYSSCICFLYVEKDDTQNLAQSCQRANMFRLQLDRRHQPKGRRAELKRRNVHLSSV